MHDRIENKTYIFAHRTPFDKLQMMDALEYERTYVKENLGKGLDIPSYTKLLSFKTQSECPDQSLTRIKTFPSITKQRKMIIFNLFYFFFFVF